MYEAELDYVLLGLSWAIQANTYMPHCLVFPEGTTVISAESYGDSAWTQTGKVVTTDSYGSRKVYFLKVCASLTII